MVMSNLKNCKQDMEFIFSELGPLLNIQEDKENLPSFGGANPSEDQMAGAVQDEKEVEQILVVEENVP